MKLVVAALSLLFTILLVSFGFYFGYDMSWQNLAAKFGIAVTTAVTFVALYTKVFSPLLKQLRGASKLMEEMGGVVRLHQDINFSELAVNIREIVIDLKPNSGTSLRDAINRIESKLLQIERIQVAFRQDGPVAIFRCSPQGQNTEVNRTYCRWLQCTEKDLLGFGWKNFLNDNDDKYEKLWTAAFSEGREFEWRLTMSDYQGMPFWVDLHAYPILNKEGKIVEYLGIMHRTDIDEGI